MLNSLRLLFLIVLFLAADANAQPDTLWSRVIGGAGDDYPTAILRASNGDIIVAVETDGMLGHPEGRYFLRMDEDGEILGMYDSGLSFSPTQQRFKELDDGGFGAMSANRYQRLNSSFEYLWTTLLRSSYTYSDDNYHEHWYGSAFNFCNDTLFFMGGDYFDVGYWDEGQFYHQHYFARRTNSSGGGYAHFGIRTPHLPRELIYLNDGTIAALSGDGGFATNISRGIDQNTWSRDLPSDIYRTGACLKESAEGNTVVVASYRRESDQWDLYYGEWTADGDSVTSFSFGDDSYQSIRDVIIVGNERIVLGVTTSGETDSSNILLARIFRDGGIALETVLGGDGADDPVGGVGLPDNSSIIAASTTSFGNSREILLFRTAPLNSLMSSVEDVTLIQPGPPTWGYAVNFSAGIYGRFSLTNFCSGTEAWISGPIGETWNANTTGSTFQFAGPVSSPTLDTLWIQNFSCSFGDIEWSDSNGTFMVEGPSSEVVFAEFICRPESTGVSVRFATDFEHKISIYEIWRRVPGHSFEIVDTVHAVGNSTRREYYIVRDESAREGISFEYFPIAVSDGGHKKEFPELITLISVPAVIPTEYHVNSFPNPFNSQTNFRIELPEAAETKILVYDITGRLAATATNRFYEAGVHDVPFDAAGLATGVYIYRFQANDFSSTNKLVLIR